MRGFARILMRDPKTTVTIAVWATLTGLLLAYLVRFGVNLPYQDEWYFTSQLVGDQPVGPWLVERHNEHLYPIGKFVYWASTRLTGDFRAAGFLTIALLSGMSLALILAARQIRGGSHIADILFLALLLHWGHFENLLIAYQIVLVLPLASVVAILCVLLRLPAARLGPSAIAVGLLLPFVLQGGGFGLAVVPPMALWMLAAAVKLVRRGESAAAGAVAILSTIYLAITTVAMATTERNSSVEPASGWDGKAVVALQYLGTGLGAETASRGRPVPWAGIAVLTGHIAAGALLVWAARTRPDEFFRAVGLTGLLVANLTIAAGLGATRDVGSAPRYALPAAVGVAVVLFAALLYGPPLSQQWSVAMGVVSIAAAGLLVGDQIAIARHVGLLRRFHTKLMLTDVRRGMPPAYLGSAHADHLFFPAFPLGPQIEPLVRGRFGPFRDASLNPQVVERAVPATVVFPPWAGGPPPSALIWSGSLRKLVGVRIRFRVETEPFLMLSLRWNGGSAVVYRRPAAGEHEALFWVNDAATELRLEQTSPGRGLTVLGVWFHEES